MRGKGLRASSSARLGAAVGPSPAPPRPFSALSLPRGMGKPSSLSAGTTPPLIPTLGLSYFPEQANPAPTGTRHPSHACR